MDKAYYLFVFVLFLPLVSAGVLDDCQVQQACALGYVEVFSMARSANAMAGIPGQYGFPNPGFKVCCKGDGLGTDCSGMANPFEVVLRLNAIRNSHAQDDSVGTYANRICLSSPSALACTWKASCDSSERCVVEVSALNNAHVAQCGSGYPYQVCCKPNAYCGNGIVDLGEECDNDAPLNPWGRIQGCPNFDSFVAGAAFDCNDPGGPLGCFFNTSSCLRDSPLPKSVCGDGRIDANETCDGDNWGPIWPDGCSWFDSWTGGILRCYPPGSPAECHFDTSGCLPPNPNILGIPMNCGNLTYDNPSTARNPDLNTSACDDSLYRGYLFGEGGLPGCQHQTDCVWANETDPTPPMRVVCRADGESFVNAAGHTIVCNGAVDGWYPVNVWCPEHFRFNNVTRLCEFNGDVCDTGKLYDPAQYGLSYSANCSLPVRGWLVNYSLGWQCMDPKDIDFPLEPDENYPKNISCCMNFSVADYNDTAYTYRDYAFFSKYGVKVY